MYTIIKAFGLYFVGIREPLKSFKYRSDLVGIAFVMGQSG